MDGISQPISSPFRGRIKVYDTPDGSDVRWTEPRRVHLHKRTPSGATLCCASVTIGGVVEDPDNWLVWLTSDQLVPESESQLEQHSDTSDESCVCIGYVKHTSRNLHYTLIDIFVNLRDTGVLTAGKDYISGKLSYKATLHPVIVKDQHRKSDLVVMTRSRHQDVMTGCITSLPTRIARPAYMGTGELMVAHFDPSQGRVPSRIDVGTWVYVRKPSHDISPETNGVRGIEELEDGMNYVGVFGGHGGYDGRKKTFIPVVLLGHIVEVDESGSKNASVRVTIQGSYEVLTEIFIRRGKLEYPEGDGWGAVDTDTSPIPT
ncbi:uncharacterized protein F4807DRAFT_466855 [Annulohypoxylon truncatum]|uniref:uncharacterized protein n=1 Tax=Annulohypoxylon truncatum TaxID=327061 RepID=UPI002008B502|nr:uncharacterized protein F4807DRAFT_466855 [Annulohypoxylon truncatum]KAI1211045.1 hypothetical protein F4807DRAFT_466855 [Annulohypoxylon truncatum]